MTGLSGERIAEMQRHVDVCVCECVVDHMRDLLTEYRRLRELVDRKWRRCPWCGHGHDEDPPHGPSCPLPAALGRKAGQVRPQLAQDLAEAPGPAHAARMEELAMKVPDDFDAQEALETGERLEARQQGQLHPALEDMLAYMDGTPAPGSDQALAAGCRCPELDNARGRGHLGRAGEWVMSADCPLHSAGLPGLESSPGG